MLSWNWIKASLTLTITKLDAIQQHPNHEQLEAEGRLDLLVHVRFAQIQTTLLHLLPTAIKLHI